eukprot:4136049-Prymnesium_polylepis.2
MESLFAVPAALHRYVLEILNLAAKPRKLSLGVQALLCQPFVEHAVDDSGLLTRDLRGDGFGHGASLLWD